MIGSCIFPEFYESPRARHATVVSVSPSKPVAPLSLQDDENGFQLRSHSFAPCDVHETVRLGCSVARALLEPILIILMGSVPAIGAIRSSCLDGHDTAGVKGMPASARICFNWVRVEMQFPPTQAHLALFLHVRDGSLRNRKAASRDRRAEAGGTEAYLRKYVEGLSDEPVGLGAT